MLEDVLKSLVASMTELAKSNRELAAAFSAKPSVETVTEEPLATENTLLNLDEIDPAELFLLGVVYGDKHITAADYKELSDNPPSKKLTGIADKISKAFESRTVKEKYFGHVLIEFTQLFMGSLDTLKTQKDFNEFWAQLEYTKPDERVGLKYTPAADKTKGSVVEQTGVEVEEIEFNDTPDYETLRKKGAAMIGDAAKANRPALVELLKKHKCVTAENKISFGAAPDAELAELVPAIESLINSANDENLA